MIDPITLSVLTHRFESIVREMGEAMLRTAYSQILNSSRDFSTAICDREATADGAGGACADPRRGDAVGRAIRARLLLGRVKPGDMFLLNDPYHGGNHLARPDGLRAGVRRR